MLYPTLQSNVLAELIISKHAKYLYAPYTVINDTALAL